MNVAATRPKSPAMRSMGLKRALRIAAAAAFLWPRASLAIDDQIQVETDDINAPGEYGLELHLNATPRGRKTPDHPGDLPPYRGARITAEFSRGLTRTLEAGFSLPAATGADGRLYPGGAKLRLKWMPVRGSEEQAGWYFGLNNELARVTQKFSESPWADELRIIGGYRADRWLVGANAVLEWGLSKGYRGSPETGFAVRATRQLSRGVAIGGEYYQGIGTLGNHLLRELQQRAVYFITEFETRLARVHVGIGHGITPASDNWTLKSVINFSFR